MDLATKMELIKILKEYEGSISYGAAGSPIDRKRKRVNRMIKKISKIDDKDIELEQNDPTCECESMKWKGNQKVSPTFEQ